MIKQKNWHILWTNYTHERIHILSLSLSFPHTHNIRFRNLLYFKETIKNVLYNDKYNE